MTVYYATDVKGGKVEVFYDQPQTQTCVHSLFPHGGYKPCWRFDRSGIQRISLLSPRGEQVAWRKWREARHWKPWIFGREDLDHLAGWPEGGKGSALGADAERAIDLAPFFPTERTAKK